MVERITIPYPGELAAATAAAIWAGTSVFYGQVGRQVSPLVLNLSKGLWAIAYILVTLLITGQSWQMPSRASGLLSLSGLVGITLGDTLFFGALNRIGARQTLLINTLSPAATAILADRFLGERLAAINYGGIALAVFGVAGIVAQQHRQSQQSSASKSSSGMGVAMAIGSALANAAASVLSRQALALETIDLSPMVTTLWRLIAGSIGLLVLLGLGRPLGTIGPLGPKFSPTLGSQIALAAFFSTYLGITLQQTALKYTAAGIAQTIGATSPVFVVLVDLGRGQVLPPAMVLYLALALGGVSLLFWGR